MEGYLGCPSRVRLLVVIIFIVSYLCVFFYPISTPTPTSNTVSAQHREHKLKPREVLRDLFEQKVNESVVWDNWKMGCTDLCILAPYFRAISDRTFKNKARLIFDVGANTGDDAETILGSFHKIVGMCSKFAVPFILVSVEPSPQVFCELEDVVKQKGWHLPAQQYHRLNIALSDTGGSRQFRDPGNEGGRLEFKPSSRTGELTSPVVQTPPPSAVPFTKETYHEVTKCRLNKSPHSHTIDQARVSIVPTYTLDNLMSSLVDLEVIQPSADIFILKIDTEGHDLKVLQGSAHLLQQHRIQFVVWEVGSNALIRLVADLMDAHGYSCFLLTPNMLVPVHTQHWWYARLNATLRWWGNGVCGIRGSRSLAMLWHMFHSDKTVLANSLELLRV